jgi:hypothetical protein
MAVDIVARQFNSIDVDTYNKPDGTTYDEKLATFSTLKKRQEQEAKYRMWNERYEAIRPRQDITFIINLANSLQAADGTASADEPAPAQDAEKTLYPLTTTTALTGPEQSIRDKLYDNEYVSENGCNQKQNLGEVADFLLRGGGRITSPMLRRIVLKPDGTFYHAQVCKTALINARKSMV